MRVYRLAMQIAEKEKHETKKNAVDFMRSNGVDDKIIQKLAEHRQDIMKSYLEEFVAEWGGER